MKNTDIQWPWLIVGQGIAGTSLALTLHKQGEKVLVVDADLAGTASAVAAGAFNPVTGKRIQLTWQAAMLWPVLEAFYPWAEELLQSSFYYNLPNIRPLLTKPERAEADKYARSGTLAPWVTVGETLPWKPEEHVHAPFGALVVSRAGFVDVRAYTHAARVWLQKQNAFRKDTVRPSEVEVLQEGIIWKQTPFKGIIWADGYKGAENLLLKDLPLAPLKGEILRVQPLGTTSSLGGVLNRAAYLAPRPDGTLWAGSTYEHFFSEPNPTEAGKTSILERIARFYKPQLNVIEHLAGIRPSVLDRRPIVGPLPQAPGHFVFTGLGTKGVSLSPWLADVFTAFLLKGTLLPLEVCVRTMAKPQPDE